mmetsp:Transcript_7655/g.21791  ORF Transcript_7655/g.21791 Transcript_7655/m.21791 type:complete len:323 (+) Transcript_7655:174-1142(+)
MSQDYSVEDQVETLVQAHQHAKGIPVPGELTADLLFRACQSGTQRPKKNEAVESFLGRVSHVTLTNKKLQHFSRSIKSCSQMRVLYAYDNFLGKIEHLDACQSLTHLYLQNNNLQDFSGLSNLRLLSKLYVDGNMISFVTGLESLTSLEELHISGQRLPQGVGLEFDPNCLVGLSRSLCVLNAARNGICDVAPLVVLSDLRKANLSGNSLQHNHMESLESILASMEKLTSLDLRDNPICTMQKYRDNIILMCQNLSELDDKPIRSTERQFLLNLHIRKLKREQALERKQMKEEAACHGVPVRNGSLHSSFTGSAVCCPAVMG